MLLTVSTDQIPLDDFSRLFHKRPDRFQAFDLSFGKALVFYIDNPTQVPTIALALDVDPVAIVRRRGSAANEFSLGQYVNDRSYVVSSFMSVAIAQVFGTAMAGRCESRPELVDEPLRLTAEIHVMPLRCPAEYLERIFVPLGYSIAMQRYILDPLQPQWGDSPYVSVTLRAEITLSEMLQHLYVLIPVFDNAKHYFVDETETEKLLHKGASWLKSHPEKEWIARRYLRHRIQLTRTVLERLEDMIEPDERPSDSLDLEETLSKSAESSAKGIPTDQEIEAEPLHEVRHQAVLDQLLSRQVGSVLDLGCSEGRFLQRLFKRKEFTRIVGLDVSTQSLERAADRLRLENLSDAQRAKIELWHGSLMYRDKRLIGFDAAVLIEVIEHFDPPRLAAMERAVFEFARPKLVVVTTPNRDYNVVWPSLSAGAFRHGDHRFEWTREEFQKWSESIAGRFGYAVTIHPIGSEREAIGSPTQMAVFELADPNTA